MGTFPWLNNYEIFSCFSSQTTSRLPWPVSLICSTLYQTRRERSGSRREPRWRSRTEPPTTAVTTWSWWRGGIRWALISVTVSPVALITSSIRFYRGGSATDHLTCQFSVERRWVWLQKGMRCIDVWCQVDIHVMKEPPNGEWTFLATELTDKSGRITYKVYIEFYNFIPSKL